MRSRLLAMFALFLLLSAGTLLPQEKGQAKGQATIPGQQTAEKTQAPENGKTHRRNAKKRRAKKGKKQQGQGKTAPGKKP